MPPVSDIASLLVVAVAVTFIGWAMVIPHEGLRSTPTPSGSSAAKAKDRIPSTTDPRAPGKARDHGC